ncbi:hypothetical protein J6J34_00930 [Pseudidiomarina sp. 1ASP75-14]|uniref:ATP-grasp domain-containing protein n=1 Tax=Pseudidiomarina terrestris TaxID=2820060 RepID=UPI00264E54A4|nr:hypothetical protein [Pseudidiomarina sp. 1ASP75-14]MDN7136780.1 hypothetical protein [Pseudidiomarina sp. 1ASP75-14]
MKDLSVAIVKSDFHGHHSGSWSDEWLKVCRDHKINHELIDWRELDSFAALSKHDVVLWHYSHYSNDEMRFAPGILAALKESGCRVFPDHSDNWHFDDKVLQAQLLEGLNLPSPKNYSLYSMLAVENWINLVGDFPVVAKLRSGSGASNVILIKNEGDLKTYAKRMFGRGLNSKPSALFKIKSNVSSSRSFKDVVARIKRAPEFLFSRRLAAGRGRERGYVYLQEFIPGVDYDLKVVVIGDQLSFIGRSVRKGDFRASGGGDLFYDRTFITQDLINTAFRASDAMRSDCAGFDMICDPKTGQPLILETSYGFSHAALSQSGGHFDRLGRWQEIPLNAPEAVLLRMIHKALN